jgi:methionyl-tRNA formyltransferase
MQRAIIDGRSETGITTMLMAAGLDTGDMLLKERVAIGEDDNFEDIHDRLSFVGASLLIKTLSGLEDGSITPEAQDDSASTYAAKIEKSDCELDFSLDAKTLHDLIRGLSPIPLSFTHTPDGKLLKVVKSKLYDAEAVCQALPGTVVEVGEDIKVACGKGILSLLTVVPEGKGKMSAADFVRGRKIAVGDVLK